jgi:hypothetical protein
VRDVGYEIGVERRRESAGVVDAGVSPTALAGWEDEERPVADDASGTPASSSLDVPARQVLDRPEFPEGCDFWEG